MLQAELEELGADIQDAIQDIVLLDGYEQTNLVWKSRTHSEYDTVYKQDVNKVFTDYDITVLIVKTVPRDELTNAGIDKTKVAKIYITQYELDRVSLELNEADRCVFQGVTYEVVKIEPLAQLGGKDVIYKVYIQEAAFSAQTEEYREKEDPYFEIDKSQPVDATDTSEVNADKFIDTAAEVIGTVAPPFVIMAADNDKLKLRVNDALEFDVTLAEGSYTADDMVIELQTKFDAAFGSGILTAFKTVTNRVGVRTVLVGVDAEIILKAVTNSAYSDLGWTVTTYTGKHKLNLSDDAAYTDGDPVYENM